MSHSPISFCFPPEKPTLTNAERGVKELASVLNQQTDLSILVEGHTDNQAVITSCDKR